MNDIWQLLLLVMLPGDNPLGFDEFALSAPTETHVRH